MIGALMIDLEGTCLTAEEMTLLEHPAVGGAIFFSRNFQNKNQLIKLVQDIRAIRPDILLAVDQEGGRVQRLQDGFTRFPPMRTLGEEYDAAPDAALAHAKALGATMAHELLEVGIDFSFAPVLDLDHGVSDVIGSRAFHTMPEVVAVLAGAWMEGMRAAGMQAVGKHYPGHGGVMADSHTDVPVDERSAEALWSLDIEPFKSLISQGLAAVMTAHVVYKSLDTTPATYSKIWLQSILREKLGFKGVIFSDDLSMQGAAVKMTMADRIQSAMAAGCDMVLICNHRPSVLSALEQLTPLLTSYNPRLESMRGART